MILLYNICEDILILAWRRVSVEMRNRLLFANLPVLSLPLLKTNEVRLWKSRWQFGTDYPGLNAPFLARFHGFSSLFCINVSLNEKQCRPIKLK